MRTVTLEYIEGELVIRMFETGLLREIMYTKAGLSKEYVYIIENYLYRGIKP